MMKHTWILPLLLCAVVCLFGKSHAAKFQGKEQITFNPYKRCCAPDQYEANLLYTGSNHKGSTSSVKVSSHLKSCEGIFYNFYLFCFPFSGYICLQKMENRAHKSGKYISWLFLRLLMEAILMERFF